MLVTAPRLAASRTGKPPLRDGGAAIAASGQRPPAVTGRGEGWPLQGKSGFILSNRNRRILKSHIRSVRPPST
jgi:hypothetical protein